MIKIENFISPSSDQWQVVLNGMRNPMNSWDKSDSHVVEYDHYCWGDYDYIIDGEQPLYRSSEIENIIIAALDKGLKEDVFTTVFVLGDNDLKLAKNLIAGGEPHPKFLRQLPVIMDITAPMYWWPQMDQYKIGTTTDSCSRMHRLTHKEFEASDFSAETLTELNAVRVDLDAPVCKGPFYMVLDALNYYRDQYLETSDKVYWDKILELLPQSYNQKRTWSANYSVLFNICRQRFNHKLSEWQDFVRWIIDNVPFFKELCLDKLCEDNSFCKWYAKEYNLEITKTVIEKKVYSLVEERGLNGESKTQ